MPLPAVTATAAIPRLDLRSIICDAFEGRNRLGGDAFKPFSTCGDAEIAISLALEGYAGRPLGNTELHVISLEVGLEWNRRRARLQKDEPAPAIDLAVFVRDMFFGATGDHALPFASLDDAEQAVTLAVRERVGRPLTQRELLGVSLAVGNRWVITQLEEEAYAEDAALAAARQMSNGQHVRVLLDKVGEHVYARGKTFILRRRLGDHHWAVFCGVDLWPAGANPHTVVTQQLRESAS
jgi:hypothetical protein